MTGGSISGLRRRNRDIVLRTIASGKPLSRSQIASQTGLTGAAVSRITRELIEVGLVNEGAAIPLKGKVGRRNIRLELGDKGAFILGIALTANVRSVSIGNSRGEIVNQRKVAGLDMENPRKAISQLTAEARELIDETEFDASRLVGCGVSVAGVANPDTGDLIRADPLGWDTLPLGSEFSQRLGLRVQVEARPIALLMAELWGGAAAGLKNIMLISNGIWAGGAIMLDGVMLRGQNNMVGQIPHLTIQGNNTLCACGRRGCINAVASGAAVLKELENIQLPGDARQLEPGDRLQSLAELRGPQFSKIGAAFRNAGRQMGYAVDQIFSIIDPELLLLAGTAGRHREYIAGIHDTLVHLRPGQQDWPIKASEVTSDQSAIWLGLNAFVYSQSLDLSQLRVA